MAGETARFALLWPKSPIPPATHPYIDIFVCVCVCVCVCVYVYVCLFIYIYGCFTAGGVGGQTGNFVANRGNFSTFVDFCPNSVNLARNKLFPPFSEVLSPEKQGWDHGEALARLRGGLETGDLVVVCLFSAHNRPRKTPHS